MSSAAQFEKFSLSESKRPVLEEGEQELLLQKDVTLYDGEKKTEFQKGVCRLTSHRIVWVAADNSVAVGVSLTRVATATDDSSGGWGASPKLRLQLSNSQVVRVAFKAGAARDAFGAKLKAALAAKAWEAGEKPAKRPKEEFATGRAGITGIIRTQESKSKMTDQSLQQAFSDINALMEKAKEMVSLSERFAAQQAKETKHTEEDSELRNVMLSMGIASPVTKESAGSLYHSELAKQLADWLRVPLSKLGGMVSLQDVYCLFNRARGTSMISPDDLYRACMLFEDLRLPVRLRKFNSGVLVIQSLDQTDEAVAKQIADLIRLDGPQTPFELARNRNISLPLATEQLQTAEKQGLVCRDETYEGVVFYLNFFADLKLVRLHLTT